MAVRIVPVDLGPHVGAWFTGRDPQESRAATQPGTSMLTGARVGQPGNLAHRRPHVPSALAADRADVARTVGYPADQWHHLRQVHGDAVAVVGEDCPPGTELREVDAAVTTLSDRPLVVQVADCVPVLLAGPHAIGVAHAGRRGVHAGVVQAAVSAMAAAGDAPSAMSAAIGPAIGGCCYEVPAEIQQQVGQVEPTAIASTTSGSPSLDLPTAVHAQLERLGVSSISRVASCTRCDPEARWFSHRGDPGAGRQVGLIVRPSPHRSLPVDHGARHAEVCA